MFSWLGRLMAGDQSAVPDEADVDRDTQGRATRIEQTLSLSQNTAKPAPVPMPSPTFQAELREAASALVTKNLRLIETCCVGLENNYGLDQETEQLTLLFPDGRQLIADGQILGSFDPRQKTFLWGWANPSLSPKMSALSNRIRATGEVRSETMLTTPEMAIKFNVISQLMAFAIFEKDDQNWDGVYRAMTNDHTSVFIAFRVSQLRSAAGNSVDAAEFCRASAWSAENTTAAEALVASYDSEMYVLDAQHHQKEESGIASQLMAQKLAVYNKHWRRDDEYWQPCSFGWPSEHDSKQYRVKISAPDGMGGLLIGHAAGPFGVTKQLYKVKLFQDGPKIVDSLIDWGKGFLLPPEQ